MMLNLSGLYTPTFVLGVFILLLLYLGRTAMRKSKMSTLIFVVLVLFALMSVFITGNQVFLGGT